MVKSFLYLVFSFKGIFSTFSFLQPFLHPNKNQHRKRWEHWDSLLPNIEIVEEDLLGETEVSLILKTFPLFYVLIIICFLICPTYYLRRQINDLGFDDKFIRTWEYYFDYCAAGFKTLTLGNYQVTHMSINHAFCSVSLNKDIIWILDHAFWPTLQVVFSRPGNVAALGDPLRSFPSA